MKKNTQVWNAAGDWYVTTWRESKLGGKRRFLKTRLATQAEVQSALASPSL